MPGPITHLVLAEKIFPRLHSNFNKAEFRIGSVFPDIRTLQVIERDKTHVGDMPFAAIQQANDGFAAGVLLHSKIDILRETFVAARGAYDQLPDSYLSTIALKLREDQLLYSRFNYWQECIQQFNQVLPQERAYGIAAIKVTEWHSMLQTLLAQPLHTKSIRNFLLQINLQPAQVTEVSRLLEFINSQGIVEAYLEDLYNLDVS